MQESVVNVTPSIAAGTDMANMVHAVSYDIIRDQVNGIFGSVRTTLCFTDACGGGGATVRCLLALRAPGNVPFCTFIVTS